MPNQLGIQTQPEALDIKSREDAEGILTKLRDITPAQKKEIEPNKLAQELRSKAN